MSIKIPKPNELSEEQMERILKICLGDDLDMYEEYVMKLSEEDQKEYFEIYPDFMKEYPVSRERLYLLKDENFRKLLRKIKEWEKSN